MRLYGKIGHLPGSRTGPRDRHVAPALAERLTSASRPGDRVIVQEKLDGSCVLVARQAGALCAYGREGRLAAESPNDGRRAFAAWVAAHAARFAWLQDGERVAGEWLALAHGTRYALPHAPFVVFDLFRAGGERVTTDALRARVAGALPLPTVLHAGAACPLDAALTALGAHGHHGARDPAEGVVYRLERDERVLALAKWVRAGKHDGYLLADHSGAGHVWNTWQDAGP